MKLAKDPGGIFTNMSFLTWASLVVLVVKNTPANAKDIGSVPGVGNGNLLP